VNVFEIQGLAMLVLLLALIAVKAFTFVNALMYSAEAFDAAMKQPKKTWITILGIGLAIQLVTLVIALGLLTSILNLGFTIAALVYLADVRPALRQVTRRR